MLRLSDWRPNARGEAAPAPEGLWADPSVAPTVLRMLAEREDGELTGLRLLHGERGLVVLGAADALPWCPGLTYLAPTAQAPTLYLPLHERPCAPLDLVARAVATKVGAPGPALLLRTPLVAVSLVRAGAVRRAGVEKLLGGAA